MADELSNYKLQLQQVEVALLSDPDNNELLKLKEDIGKLKTEKFVYDFLILYFINFRSTDHTSKGTNQNTGK